ncbi:MAG: Calcineurin-like phosphoesterase [Firmicutes bacterium ADurb.Bin182]|nr:MAG: Calcineurin-like phosphoesterase [Firmicutes bacterium ADurb.Bin182]
MRVFAIGDLHLPGNYDKPMNVFGIKWDNHFSSIQSNWKANVRAEDVVLIPGDISWAMRLEDAKEDLDAVAALPGIKILLRGNHDYWWSSVSKVRVMLDKRASVLQNDSISVNGLVFAGTRGWICPGTPGFDSADERIYKREVQRLRLSLDSAQKGRQVIAMMHFPPFNDRQQASGFTDLLEEYGIKHVIYAHLHGKSCENAFEGNLRGINYTLCSADHLNFCPKLVFEN